MMDYQFEQKGRRPIVVIAALFGGALVAIGLYYHAPWYFLAMPGIAGLMAALMLIQNSTSGLKLTAQSLTLYKDNWQEEIPLSTIKGLRTTQFSSGQPSVWLDRNGAPPYRIPGYCFGSAQQLRQALAVHGIATD
jgi:hypothetical protein